MRKSRQWADGSLLTGRPIGEDFHSATARMSEGGAGANGALRALSKFGFVGLFDF